MSVFTTAAEFLEVDERTVRRAARDGMVRSRWPTERRAELVPGETAYLRTHGSLLFAIRGALRTEPNVCLAVVFGSFARGEAKPTSDVDLLVDVDDERIDRIFDLEERLSTAAGRAVHAVRLSTARREPWLLAEVIEDGRVIVDRDGGWPALRARQSAFARAGRRQLTARATRAVERTRALTPHE